MSKNNYSILNLISYLNNNNIKYITNKQNNLIIIPTTSPQLDFICENFTHHITHLPITDLPIIEITM
jgi:hypothetical protein